MLLISCAPGSSLRVAVKIQTSELLERGAKASRTRRLRSRVCAVQEFVRFKCPRCSQNPFQVLAPGSNQQRAHGTMQIECFRGVQNPVGGKGSVESLLSTSRSQTEEEKEEGVGRPKIFFSGSHACSYVSHSSSDLLFFSVPASTGVLSRINYERPAHDAHFHSAPTH